MSPPNDPDYWKKYRRKWHNQAAKRVRHCVRCDTDKPACYVHTDKKTGEPVCRPCRKKVHPDKKRPPKKRVRDSKVVRVIQARYLSQNSHKPEARRNHGQEWTIEEDRLIMASDRPSDPELEILIGRSLDGIHNRRYRLRKKQRARENAA